VSELLIGLGLMDLLHFTFRMQALKKVEFVRCDDAKAGDEALQRSWAMC
jgi:hypothetical protein